MTDRQALASFGLEQAKETLTDAKTMLHSAVSPRLVINRTYYVMFYALLALCHHAGSEVTTSKHSGIISLFDKELIHTGKLEKNIPNFCTRLLS